MGLAYCSLTFPDLMVKLHHFHPSSSVFTAHRGSLWTLEWQLVGLSHKVEGSQGQYKKKKNTSQRSRVKVQRFTLTAEVS